jgi:hypothetical protein
MCSKFENIEISMKNHFKINKLVFLIILTFIISCSTNDQDIDISQGNEINRIYPLIIDQGTIGVDSFIYNQENQLIKIIRLDNSLNYTQFFYNNNKVDSIYSLEDASKYFYNESNQLWKVIYYYNTGGYYLLQYDTIYFNYENNVLISADYRAVTANYRQDCIHFNNNENNYSDSIFQDCNEFMYNFFYDFDNKINPFYNLNLPFTFNKYHFISGRNNWINNAKSIGWRNLNDPPYSDANLYFLEYDINDFPINISGVKIVYTTL